MTCTPIAPTLPHALPTTDDGSRDKDDDIVHISCCVSDERHISLCGLDVTDLPVASDDDDVSCADCIAMFHTDFCPILLTCTECHAWSSDPL